MKIPTPKPHKTGQAYIYWQRKCIYFGKYGTPEADEKYWQWRKSMTGGVSPTVKQYLVIDLLNLYASSHAGRKAKDKYKAITDLGPLVRYHCHEYTPLIFRKHRERIASTGTRCARHVNDLMRLIQRIFRWGVSMEMCSLDTYSRLKTVDPLKAHEVEHQSKKRVPAKREDVEKTMDELNPMAMAVVKLILYTGARPGEICGMMASEITKDGPHGVWVYRPDKHKTTHHGKRRYVVFGPKGRAIVKEWWPRHGDYFFPSRLIVGHYQPSSLRQAVGHACKRAGVPHWSPYQIRHLRMTELAVDKGLEVAASVAGHGETQTTRLYQHEPDVIALREAL